MYALTGDLLYREKAQEVADKLLPAFQTPTGIPNGRINIRTGVRIHNRSGIYAANMYTYSAYNERYSKNVYTDDFPLFINYSLAAMMMTAPL